jgi:hypothetical protein
MGRRLLTLLNLSNGRGSRQELSQEAHLMGEDYGREMLQRSISLSQAVEAFIFFHTSLLEVTEHDSWPRLCLLTNQVLRGVCRAYEGARVEGDPLTPRSRK